MGEANMGRSNKDEEVNPPKEPSYTTPTTNIKTTLSPTRPSHDALRSSLSRNAAQPSHPQPKLHKTNQH
jgi:hypothetical protein